MHIWAFLCFKFRYFPFAVIRFFSAVNFAISTTSSVDSLFFRINNEKKGYRFWYRGFLSKTDWSLPSTEHQIVNTITPLHIWFVDPRCATKGSSSSQIALSISYSASWGWRRIQIADLWSSVSFNKHITDFFFEFKFSKSQFLKNGSANTALKYIQRHIWIL